MAKRLAGSYLIGIARFCHVAGRFEVSGPHYLELIGGEQ